MRPERPINKIGVRSRRDLVGSRARHDKRRTERMTTRVLVVGADATGMSAASQALRHAGRNGLTVMAFERGHHTSYSACGIPYWVAGDVPDPDALIARSAAEHRANGIDLRLRTEITEIDFDARTVRAAPLDGGASYQVGFDDLVLAPVPSRCARTCREWTRRACTAYRPSTMARLYWTA